MEMVIAVQRRNGATAGTSLVASEVEAYCRSIQLGCSYPRSIVSASVELAAEAGSNGLVAVSYSEKHFDAYAARYAEARMKVMKVTLVLNVRHLLCCVTDHV